MKLCKLQDSIYKILVANFPSYPSSKISTEILDTYKLCDAAGVAMRKFLHLSQHPKMKEIVISTSQS